MLYSKGMATQTFRGKPACSCLIEWLPVYEKELLRRKVIKSNIDIYQLIGGAAASGGTHATGGAFDIAQTSATAIYVARQMGADATWYRPPNWDGAGGMPHTHGVLRNCPHNGPARYQITAVDKGYNGLGHLGMGASSSGVPSSRYKDTGPRPLSGRTWRQGIEWANALSAPKPPVKNRIEKARDLLTLALRTTNGKRQAAIQKALDTLPIK